MCYRTEKNCCLQVYLCTIQPRNFTGWGSEGVKTKTFWPAFFCLTVLQSSGICHIQSSHAFKPSWILTHLYKQLHNNQFHILSSFFCFPSRNTFIIIISSYQGLHLIPCVKVNLFLLWTRFISELGLSVEDVGSSLFIEKVKRTSAEKGNPLLLNLGHYSCLQPCRMQIYFEKNISKFLSLQIRAVILLKKGNSHLIHVCVCVCVREYCVACVCVCCTCTVIMYNCILF